MEGAERQTSEAMIGWLYPVDAPVPPIPPVRVVCNVRGWWVYYPAYESVAEYHEARTALVDGALQLLESDDDGGGIVILLQSPEMSWIGWLLPMMWWNIEQEPEPGWDPAVADFAELFTSGVLPSAYRGPCGTTSLRSALNFCTDVVIRNLAPDSWLFVNTETSVAVYFHNTSSIGIHAPVSETPEDVVRRIRVPELHCEVFERPSSAEVESP